MLSLSTAQLCMLRSMQKNGWAEDIIEYVWTRSGGTKDDWTELINAGLVAKGKYKEKGRYILTKLGFKEYKRQKQGKMF